MTIRKAIPILWKYLLVVMTSCTLAFVISQQSRAAQVSGATPLKSAAVAAGYDAAGSYAINTSDAIWQDEARKRGVPVRIISPTLADGEVSTKFPVIIFSHGLGGSRVGGKLWGEHWASHGYTVVHLQHPGSDESIWKSKPPDQIEGNLKRAMTMSNLGLRVGDVHFVIDQIVRRADAGSGAFKFADAKQIGMSGHSFGAQTTLAVAGQASPSIGGQSGFDRRISAALAFSPNARNKNKMEKQFGDIRMPFLSITGSKDGAVLNDGTTVADRTLPFQHMPAGDKYLLVLEGADHMVFGGLATPRRKAASERDAEIKTDVKAVTLAFWNAYLKADVSAKAWLAAGNGDKSPLAGTLAANDRFDSK